jgi:hypothetical protein
MAAKRGKVAWGQHAPATTNPKRDCFTLGSGRFQYGITFRDLRAIIRRFCNFRFHFGSVARYYVLLMMHSLRSSEGLMD